MLLKASGLNLNRNHFTKMNLVLVLKSPAAITIGTFDSIAIW